MPYKLPYGTNQYPFFWLKGGRVAADPEPVIAVLTRPCAQKPDTYDSWVFVDGYWLALCAGDVLRHTDTTLTRTFTADFKAVTALRLRSGLPKNHADGSYTWVRKPYPNGQMCCHLSEQPDDIERDVVFDFLQEPLTQKVRHQRRPNGENYTTGFHDEMITGGVHFFTARSGFHAQQFVPLWRNMPEPNKRLVLLEKSRDTKAAREIVGNGYVLPDGRIVSL